MNYRIKALLIGGVAGALLGTALAWAASDNHEDEEAAVSALGPSDYFALGISLLTLARQFSNMLK